MVLAAALAVGGCAPDGRVVESVPGETFASASPAASPGATDDPAASIVPTGPSAPHVEMGDCPFDPHASLQLDCGHLLTTERADGTGAEVVLPFAVVRTARKPPSPEPVLLLGGGPGPGLEALVEAARAEIPFLLSSDVIVLEYRGTGLATPSLRCPEMSGLPTVAMDGRAVADMEAAIISATGDCASRVRASGIDPAAYRTSDRVRDLVALRRALGIETWKIYGTSYGTQVALELLTTDPTSVRAVVLDGVLPPGADLFHEIGANGVRARGVLFAECGASGGCGDERLDETFDELARRLEDEPRPIDVEDPWTRTTRRATADGETLVKGVFGLLYGHAIDASLPDLIAAATTGDPELLQRGVVAQLGWVEGDFGAFLTHLCGEAGWDGSTGDLGPTFASLPTVDATAWERHRELHARQCAAWGVSPSQPDDVGRSDVPALLLAGAFDPITPPRWAARAAERLSRAVLRTFSGAGHGVLFGGPRCADALALAFLDDPATAPQRACGDEGE